MDNESKKLAKAYLDGKKAKKRTDFTLRLVAIAALCALVAATALSVFLAFRARKESERIKAEHEALLQAQTDGGMEDELATLRLEAAIDESVKTAYETYQADLQNILAVAGIIFTLFSIGVPLMQYQFITKERVEELDRRLEKLQTGLDDVDGLKKDVGELKKDLSQTTQEQKFGTSVGAIMLFGGLEWLVLDIKEKRALLITKAIIKKMPYHSSGDETTWEHCSLRTYLKDNFFDDFGFSEEDRQKVADTQNKNPNMIYVTADGKTEVNTRGGNPTLDKVFLLSVEEAKQYFHTTEHETPAQFKNILPKTYPQSDELIAEYGKSGSWWWLRSPGDSPGSAAGVNNDGDVGFDGYAVDTEGGVRPALWINLKS